MPLGYWGQDYWRGGGYITVTSYWERVQHKSPATRLFTQPFVQVQIKENIKAPRHWPFWGEFTGDFPAQRASNAENVSIWWRHRDKDGYHIYPKLILNWNFAKSRSSITSVSFQLYNCFCNFARSTAVPLWCSVQNFKAIAQLRNKLCADEISRDLERISHIAQDQVHSITWWSTL